MPKKTHIPARRALLPTGPTLDRHATIRVSIDGAWEAPDFASYFRALNLLYYLCLPAKTAETKDERTGVRWIQQWALQQYRGDYAGTASYVGMQTIVFHSHSPRPFGSPALIREHPGLEDAIFVIRRVQYASPGFTDFAGVGAAMKELFVFLRFLLEHFSGRDSRKIGKELQGQELLTKRIENAVRLVSLAQSCGCTPEEQRRLLNTVQEAQEPLIDLVAQGKIRNAELDPPDASSK